MAPSFPATAPGVPGPRRLRSGRVSLAVSFFGQGVVFALLVTRIPALQDQYGISDALLPAFLAAVPVLAGAGSVGTEAAVGTGCGPRAMSPKYFSTRGFAVAASMSPLSTSTALFGP